MTDDLRFIEEYRNKPVLFDANLLLVYVAGKLDVRQLRRSHRTKQYADDFPLLQKLVDYFSDLQTTPNVLTEVSNLGKDFGVAFFDELKSAISLLDERFCSSSQASSHPGFRKLGLTDGGLAIPASEILIITADYTLYQMIRNSGLDAVNFNYVRTLAW